MAIPTIVEDASSQLVALMSSSGFELLPRGCVPRAFSNALAIPYHADCTSSSGADLHPLVRSSPRVVDVLLGGLSCSPSGRPGFDLCLPLALCRGATPLPSHFGGVWPQVRRCTDDLACCQCILP